MVSSCQGNCAISTMVLNAVILGVDDRGACSCACTVANVCSKALSFSCTETLVEVLSLLDPIDLELLESRFTQEDVDDSMMVPWTNLFLQNSLLTVQVLTKKGHLTHLGHLRP